jgi:SAM-dependent methyltransferase
MSPLANSYVQPRSLGSMERFYPLCAWVCDSCFLVQLEEFETPDQIFSDYLYFASYSTSWLEHCRRYVEQVTDRFRLNSASQVIEIASNDGYLLQYFVERSVPVLGIEPAANVAEVARSRGIPTRCFFLGAETAQELRSEGLSADLLICNNVIAHVPNPLSFVRGLSTLLKSSGVITLEFPHLMQLMLHRQFDTIYHEHFSYFSLLSLEALFARFSLRVFDVEELPTHGGSLRVYAAHREDEAHETGPRVQRLRDAEAKMGLGDLAAYGSFAESVKDVKCDLLEFLIRARREKKRVAGYGAPAKGNTLLNYCGVGRELLSYTVDLSPHKQGLFLPGTHIPIFAPDKLLDDRPDFVVILPWNLRTEICEQMRAVRDWGGKFVVPIPSLEVF